jgi:hypothetical protein
MNVIMSVLMTTMTIIIYIASSDGSLNLKLLLKDLDDNDIAMGLEGCGQQ